MAEGLDFCGTVKTIHRVFFLAPLEKFLKSDPEGLILL